MLRALRSHDDRLNAEINKIDLNNTPTNRIIFSGNGIDVPEKPRSLELPFLPLDLPPGAIFAKIVDKCGDRKYWETWAKDVADIFQRLVYRIEGLLDVPENELLRQWFGAFHGELKFAINDSDHPRQCRRNDGAACPDPAGVSRLLFEHYDFAARNPGGPGVESLAGGFRGLRPGERNPGSGALLCKAYGFAPGDSTTAKHASAC